MDSSVEEVLLNGDEEKLNELKRFLFQENIRLTLKQKEIYDMFEKFTKERAQFQEEKNAINLKIVTERERLKDEEQFFDKKMEILKNGFAELEADRRRFDKEKAEFKARTSQSVAHESVDYGNGVNLFAGVNNPLALKKRYRDLLKIFHPDNLCGDTEIVSIINKEYERLKKELDYPFRSVN